jgi:formylglycine-generating enzyme required for sulfatase activity
LGARVAGLPSVAAPPPEEVRLPAQPAPAAEEEDELAALQSSRQKPEPASPVQPAVGVYEQQSEYRPGDEFRDCNQCPLLVVVPAGSFVMGSTEAERRWALGQGADPWRVELEKPQHGVTIPAPFAVGKYEVTFDEWDACATDGGCNGYKPADEGWGRRLRPVINVSWKDAQAYVEWLSKKTGKPYRLLSEAEWEYAARAGTTTRYSWGDTITRKNANYGGKIGKTAEVGSYLPNPWGLYEMHGSVWEWCEDCAYNSYDGAPGDGSAWTIEGNCGGRVGRGGSWDGPPGAVRSAIRGWSGSNTSHREKFTGFRLAMTLLAQ